MSTLFFWECLGHFLVFLSSCSFAEWGLHKYIMHRPLRILFWTFDYPFKAHALVHHDMYGADSTYHAQEGDSGKKIPMAWWNSFAIIGVGCALMTGYFWFFGWKWLFLAIPVMFGYYGVYEFMHYCMHMPEDRKVEASWFFRWMNARHILHHKFMHKNFNVVLPIADILLGTYIRYSPKRFDQVRGPSVPDVQPQNAAADKG